MIYRLESAGLTCARGDRPLFSNLSLEVASGELLHVVGSNGSGKTTLLRTVCGLSRPAAGEIRWQGEPIQALGDEYRRELIYVGHLDGVQGELTPAENLRAQACYAGATHALASGPRSSGSEIDEALERLELTALNPFPAKVLSQGQRRRLALARLLLARKPLWVLDEPFTALDARSCELTNALLGEHLVGGGVAVISSHQRLELPGASIKRLDLEHLGTHAPAQSTKAPVDARLPAGRQRV